MSYIGFNNDKCDVGESPRNIFRLRQQIIKLNDGETGTGVDSGIAGINVERGQLPDALIQWNDEIDLWEYGTEGNLRIFDKVAVKINTSVLAKPFHVYLVDTSGAEVTVLLPSNPKMGDEVEFIDLKGKFDLHVLIILGNGSKILGANEDAILDVKYANVKFVYVDLVNGWALAPSNPITLSNIDINFELTPEILIEIQNYIASYITENFESLIENTIIVYINENVDTLINNHIEIYINENIDTYIYNYITNNTDIICDELAGPGLFKNSNDKLEVDIGTGLSIVNNKLIVIGGSPETEIKSTSFTPSTNIYYALDTTLNEITVTLPSNPTTGTWFGLLDLKGNFGINKVTVLNSGNKIFNVVGDLELDLDNINIRLVFIDDNWIILNDTINYRLIGGDPSTPSNPSTIEIKSTSFTPSTNIYYAVNTTLAPITVTLPSNPTTGTWFGLLDLKGNFKTNKVTVLNSGNKIFNVVGNLELNLDNINIRLVFIDDNWIILNDTINYRLIGGDPSTPSTKTVETKSVSFVASVNTYYLINALNSLSVTLPSNPVNGDWFKIVDMSQMFETNTVMLLNDGVATIANTTDDIQFDIRGMSAELIFNNGNWNIVH